MKASAKRRKTANPRKKQVPKVNDWIRPGTSPYTTPTSKVRRPARVLFGLAIVAVVVVYVIAPATQGGLKNAYYRLFPTPEMQQLRAVKKSLGLPRAVSVSYDDRGCHGDGFLFESYSTWCDRHIELDFASADFVKPLQQKLAGSGWKPSQYDTDDPNGFFYVKTVGGQKICISASVIHAADPPVYFWIYAGIDGWCSGM